MFHLLYCHLQHSIESKVFSCSAVCISVIQALKPVTVNSTDAIPPSTIMWVAMAKWRCLCFHSLTQQAEEHYYIIYEVFYT